MKVALRIIFFLCLFTLGILQVTHASEGNPLQTFIERLSEIGIGYNEDPCLPLNPTEDGLTAARQRLTAMRGILGQYDNPHCYVRSYMDALIIGQIAVIHWIEAALAENESDE